jgi:glucose-6-phosphate 1-dehydrogenase
MTTSVESAPVNVARPQLPPVEPCTVVIFGASGDLARRKLIPALYNLACEDCIGRHFNIIGIGRTETSDDDYRKQMRDAVTASKDTRNFSEAGWQSFAERLTYMTGDPNNNGSHEELAARLDAMSKSGKDGGASRNRIYYLSTPPSAAASIIQGLGSAGLANDEHGWARIIIEKPFGRDLQSARALNEAVARVFREDQVYRIDHFLGKDTVQNILVFRFGNSMFEPFWNRNYIDYVEITAAETLGVGSRASFYEETGALRDMIANHLLQVLTLTAMEPPIRLDANSIREKKVEVLRSIQPLSREEMMERTVRGQYRAGEMDGKPALAYREEQSVAADSPVDTYAAIEFRIDNWRWAGVPFYVRSGKRLKRKLTEIAVHLRRTPQALFAQGAGVQAIQGLEPNVIVLQIQPEESISISFAAKRPGVEMETGTAELDFNYESSFHLRSPEAYETLLLDTMQGDVTLFTRRDETEAQWKLITPINEAWASEDAPPLAFYPAGSDGPAEADALLARNGHMWRKL